MKPHMISKVLIMTVALMLTFVFTASAATVFILEDTAVYAKPDTGSKKYGTLQAGQKYEMVDSGSGWAKLKSGSSVGYVRLEDVGVQKLFNGETVYVDGDTALQKNFSSSSAFASLDDGTAVQLYATAGDWAYIKVGGKYGLVRKSDLTTKKPEEKPAEKPAEKPEDEGAQEETENTESITAYVAKDGAKAYKSASTSSKVLARLDLNEKLNVVSVSGSWAKVEKNGAYGYMRVSDLSTEKVEVVVKKTFTAYVKEDGVNGYDEWSGKGEVVKTFRMDDKVTVTAYNSTWACVKYDGKTMYIKTADLSTEKNNKVVTRTFTAYVKADGVKAYDAWDGNGNAVETFDMDDKVTVTAYNNTWACVKYNGKTMYMKNEDLSTEVNDKVVNETFTAYAKDDGVKGYDAWNGSGKTVKTFNINDTVTVTAYNSKWACVKCDGKTMYMKVEDLSREKIATGNENGSTVKPATGTAREMDWWDSEIRTIFPVGKVVKITDVETGIAWQVKRSGGTNHADVQPLTAEDTAAMFKVYGGKWSWTRRAVFVTIDGENYAASINGMPHGSGSITDNNFEGHHCVHFTNSRTHGTNRKDADHQEMIKKAAGTTLR